VTSRTLARRSRVCQIDLYQIDQSRPITSPLRPLGKVHHPAESRRHISVPRRRRRRTMARAARGSDAARVDSLDDSPSGGAPPSAHAGASADGVSPPSDDAPVAGGAIVDASSGDDLAAGAESAENKAIKNVARLGGARSGDAPREGGGDGTLSVTPDSPADSEWRARRGPLDASEGGPWASEDAAGACDCESMRAFAARGRGAETRR